MRYSALHGDLVTLFNDRGFVIMFFPLKFQVKANCLHFVNLCSAYSLTIQGNSGKSHQCQTRWRRFSLVLEGEFTAFVRKWYGNSNYRIARRDWSIKSIIDYNRWQSATIINRLISEIYCHDLLFQNAWNKINFFLFFSFGILLWCPDYFKTLSLPLIFNLLL